MEDERLPDNAAKSCSASPDRAFGDGANDKTLVQPVRPAKTMNQLVVKIELDSGICFSIDASNLDAPTTIFFAGDTSITITPSAVGEVIRDKRFNLNRRENDRRQTERRTNATVVQFERRTDETRRMVQRRGVSGR